LSAKDSQDSSPSPRRAPDREIADIIHIIDEYIRSHDLNELAQIRNILEKLVHMAKDRYELLELMSPSNLQTINLHIPVTDIRIDVHHSTPTTEGAANLNPETGIKPEKPINTSSNPPVSPALSPHLNVPISPPSEPSLPPLGGPIAYSSRNRAPMPFSGFTPSDQVPQNGVTSSPDTDQVYVPAAAFLQTPPTSPSPPINPRLVEWRITPVLNADAIPNEKILITRPTPQTPKKGAIALWVLMDIDFVQAKDGNNNFYGAAHFLTFDDHQQEVKIWKQSLQKLTGVDDTHLTAAFFDNRAQLKQAFLQAYAGQLFLLGLDAKQMGDDLKFSTNMIVCKNWTAFHQYCAKFH
jgi:hypothetical protein